jgi:hypothetical protein
MLDILIKILESLYKLLPQLKRPIAAEVNGLGYCLTDNWSSLSVVIITPYPSRYQASLRLTNKRASVVFVKDIILTINDSRTYKCIKPKIRLEPEEPIEQTVIFPVDPETKPDRKGKFLLEIIPGVGRRTGIKGTFPEKNPETQEESEERYHREMLESDNPDIWKPLP